MGVEETFDGSANFTVNGFNEEGYDMYGYDKDGKDEDGYDKNGYKGEWSNDGKGYDKDENGYDQYKGDYEEDEYEAECMCGKGKKLADDGKTCDASDAPGKDDDKMENPCSQCPFGCMKKNKKD